MRLIAMTSIAMLASIASVAQVTIIGSRIDPELFSQASFLQLSLSNTGPAVSVVVSGEVRSKEGNQILVFRSGAHPLPSGAVQLRSSALTMQQFMFGADARSRAAAMEHRLPAGNYHFCVRVTPAQVGEFQDEFCDTFEADDRLFMDLVYPMDGDTIDEVRPVLSWTITSGKVPPGQVAKALLVPLVSGMDAYQAVAASRPVFVADGLQRLVIPYPMGVPDLERGRCYAWQVERFLEGASIDRTEAWRFCVRSRRELSPDRYVRVGPYISDAVVEAKDEMLHLLCAEGSGTAAVDVRIILPQGLTLSSTSEVKGHGNPVITSTGQHLFEVDLQQCNLQAGEYVLIVMEAGRELGKLRFRIAS